jgi:hypothetical protein
MHKLIIILLTYINCYSITFMFDLDKLESGFRNIVIFFCSLCALGGSLANSIDRFLKWVFILVAPNLIEVHDRSVNV